MRGVRRSYNETIRRVAAYRSFASNIRSDPITHFVFGANTDIGKTVLTAALIRASYGEGGDTHYVKPLQCGGSDEGFVRKNAQGLSSAKTLFDWDTPASPHLAARIENKPVSDKDVLTSLTNYLDTLTKATTTERGSIWVETAGGVLSPSSSSPHNDSSHHARSGNSWGWVTQADLYTAFRDRSSIVLIGDGRLGGISATLASLEAMLHRDYTVNGILLLRGDDSSGVDTNQEALKEYVYSYAASAFSEDESKILQCGVFADPEKSIVSLPKLPPEPEPLDEWYDSNDVKDPISSFVHGHLFRC